MNYGVFPSVNMHRLSDCIDYVTSMIVCKDMSRFHYFENQNNSKNMLVNNRDPYVRSVL